MMTIIVCDDISNNISIFMISHVLRTLKTTMHVVAIITSNILTINKNVQNKIWILVQYYKLPMMVYDKYIS